jgi:hypothetical protein
LILSDHRVSIRHVPPMMEGSYALESAITLIFLLILIQPEFGDVPYFTEPLNTSLVRMVTFLCSNGPAMELTEITSFQLHS